MKLLRVKDVKCSKRSHKRFLLLQGLNKKSIMYLHISR